VSAVVVTAMKALFQNPPRMLILLVRLCQFSSRFVPGMKLIPGLMSVEVRVPLMIIR